MWIFFWPSLIRSEVRHLCRRIPGAGRHCEGRAVAGLRLPHAKGAGFVRGGPHKAGGMFRLSVVERFSLSCFWAGVVQQRGQVGDAGPDRENASASGSCAQMYICCLSVCPGQAFCASVPLIGHLPGRVCLWIYAATAMFLSHFGCTSQVCAPVPMPALQALAERATPRSIACTNRTHLHTRGSWKSETRLHDRLHGCRGGAPWYPIP